MWQDALVVLAFYVLERVTRRIPLVARVTYAALLALAAIDVPVTRVLSSPLTAPMLRAARGTLADSIVYYVTPLNLALIAFILAMGVALPWVPAARWPAWLRAANAWKAAAVAVVVIGGLGASRVDTAGLERNSLLALVRTTLPRVRAHAADAEWRASPFASDTAEDLSRFRGVAAGHNVLLVVLESTAAQYLKTFGAAEDPMPNLTALASHSIVFENAYAVYPESIKGLISILSSRYPAFDVSVERHVGIIAPSLATTLASAGYATALFHSGRFMYLGMDAVLSRSGFTLMEDAGDIGGNHNSSFGIDERSTVLRILQWIDTLPGEKRFFATYLPVAGHHPYAYTERGPFSDSLEIDRYRNALHEGDRALGELLDGLRARGLDRSTLIVVIGDHGEAFGQHPGNTGHTLAVYEENVHVPMVVSLPGAQHGEQRVRRVASLLDVAPTMLDLLGVKPPAAFQGESLLASRQRMALFFTDYSLGLLGLRDGCLKYIHALESGRSKTYDVCRDPGEHADLTASLADRTARYRDRLGRWSAAQVARVLDAPPQRR
jgi:phosphoglycerol transferase MdoB-like AlkP superfamily enzyme